MAFPSGAVPLVIIAVIAYSVMSGKRRRGQAASMQERFNAQNAAQVQMLTERAAELGLSPELQARLMQKLEAIAAAANPEAPAAPPETPVARPAKPVPSEKHHKKKHSPLTLGSVPLPSREPLAALAPFPPMRVHKAFAPLPVRDPISPL